MLAPHLVVAGVCVEAVLQHRWLVARSAVQPGELRRAVQVGDAQLPDGAVVHGRLEAAPHRQRVVPAPQRRVQDE